MTKKTIEGASGLNYNQGFNSETMGEMVYKGNNIGMDSKGRKHEILRTTLVQSDEDFLRGVRMRFYKTKLLKIK